jgi:hypothetical protein
MRTPAPVNVIRPPVPKLTVTVTPMLLVINRLKVWRFRFTIVELLKSVGLLIPSCPNRVSWCPANAAETSV